MAEVGILAWSGIRSQEAFSSTMILSTDLTVAGQRRISLPQAKDPGHRSSPTLTRAHATRLRAAGAPLPVHIAYLLDGMLPCITGRVNWSCLQIKLARS